MGDNRWSGTIGGNIPPLEILRAARGGGSGGGTFGGPGDIVRGGIEVFPKLGEVNVLRT
jgi:hypothetical protein